MNTTTHSHGHSSVFLASKFLGDLFNMLQNAGRHVNKHTIAYI